MLSNDKYKLNPYLNVNVLLSLNISQTGISCSMIRPVNCHGITDMARAKNPAANSIEPAVN